MRRFIGSVPTTQLLHQTAVTTSDIRFDLAQAINNCVASHCPQSCPKATSLRIVFSVTHLCSNRCQDFLSPIPGVCVLQASATSHSVDDGAIDVGKAQPCITIKWVFHPDQQAGSCVRNPVQVCLLNSDTYRMGTYDTETQRIEKVVCEITGLHSSSMHLSVCLSDRLWIACTESLQALRAQLRNSLLMPRGRGNLWPIRP